MNIFYFSDNTKPGFPYIFVVETDSVESAEKAFKEQTGIDLHANGYGIHLFIARDQNLNTKTLRKLSKDEILDELSREAQLLGMYDEHKVL
jgi:hypothetical protein